jgi:cytochrome c oxidase assembly factor CtaG
MRPEPYAWGFTEDEVVVLVPLLVVAYVVAAQIARPSRARAAAYAAGVALILLAFLTPLQSLSLHYLLSAHLLQNVVLAEWAPALCVLGLPPLVARRMSASGALRALTHPAVALPLWLGTYFAWHVPRIYDAALEHPTWLLHLEHLSYLAAGALLWWPVLQAAPHRLSSGAKALYVFAAFVLASPLGLLLALVPSTVYAFYERAPELWGLSHLADQQLAGVTMAAEQAIVFFAVFVGYLGRHLRAEEGREQLRSFPAER